MEVTLTNHMPECVALMMTQNHFGYLLGELTGLHILSSAPRKWVLQPPTNATEHQKKILDEAEQVIDAVVNKYDLFDLGLKMERALYAKGEYGIYKFAFYETCFYVVIFDRKAVEDWYNANIENILQETEALIKRGVIRYPKDEWECTDSQGYCYDVVIHVGDWECTKYSGTLSQYETDSFDRQIARQLVCINIDAMLADYLKENGDYDV